MIRTFLFLLLFAAPLMLRAQTDPERSALTEVESLYNNGQYISAELIARQFLEEPSVSDSARIAANKWIAFSLIAQGKSAPARERFVNVLRVDENFELDPVLTSPKIMAVFNDAKVRFLMLKKEETKRAELSAAGPAVIAPSFRTLVFPGWEQLHQGRSTTGWAFAGAGAAALVSGITCEALRSSARQDYLNAVTASSITSRYDRYNTYRRMEYYSFGAFVLLYLGSQADVLLSGPVTVQPSVSQRGIGEVRFSLRF